MSLYIVIYIYKYVLQKNELSVKKIRDERGKGLRMKKQLFWNKV